MVPACYRCGTVGHRPDACPNPDNQRCIHCGAKVELTPEGPAKHDCQPECLICSENHFTGSAQCVGKFRKAWKPAQTQRQHGLKNKQEPPASLRTDEKAKPMHNKPKPIKAPAVQKSRPPTFGTEDFPSLANPPKQVSNWVGVSSQSLTTTTASPSNSEILKQLEAMKKRIETLERENRALKASQAATPPPPSEPVAMHTSDCSDDEHDTQSDVLECAVYLRRYTLELRSCTLPLFMTDNANPSASSPQFNCPGHPRLRDPKVFSGADGTDVEDWLD
ncbi:hypothetical protein HPB51_024374 [Rhipicephalus microplus]|uniref:CCHC-type domain-containing protein n=1 Tax=Rhipicephalus microplus TaxID=6941 RepID=A0A9J6D7J1_RHIMP|nr:hypothetical protein HPB51_024374 [Rhipicephalus microplus]